MPENDPIVEPLLDAEDWEIVFKVYEGHPALTLMLAYHLSALKEFLQSDPADIRTALAAIDRAIDSLYPHTNFRGVSHQLFRTAIEGKLTTEQEQMINQMGITT